MQICNNNHQDICYEDRSCPLCEALDIIKELEKKGESLDKEIIALEEENSALEEKLTEKDT